MKISAQVFTHEALNILYITYEKSSALRSESPYLSDRKICEMTLLPKNLEVCILHI